MQPDDDLAGLRRRRWTRKIETWHADERDRPDVRSKRRSFRRRARRIEPARLDLSMRRGGTTAMIPAYAWAPRGERATDSAPGSWETVTVIAALGLDVVRRPSRPPSGRPPGGYER